MSASPTEEGLWDEQAGDWAELQESQCAPLFAAALAALGARSGMTLLDIGCGSGVALRQAADRGAAVSGLDFSAGLIDLARRRVPEAVDLRVGGMDALPFEDASFEAVMSFNALRYAADPAATVTEFARVTRAGGAVCIGGWGDPPECETTGFLFAVVLALPELPQGSGEDAPNTPARIREVMRRAGLEPAEIAKVPCPFVYDDVEAAWRALGATGLLRFAVERLGEPAVRDLFDAHFRPAVLPDGTVRQENTFEYSIARLPA